MQDESATILVGEDESEVRSYLEMALKCQGYQVQTASDGEELLSYFAGGAPYSAVLLDIMMPVMDGLETLREIRRVNHEIPVIMLSGASSPVNVVQAMKDGATDFLAKPASHDELGRTLRKALANEAIPSPRLRPPAPSDSRFYGLGARMRQLRSMVDKVAPSNVPVLIQGETGTGKEVLARQIHELSPRAAKPFVKLNCAAVPSELMESELFGYERGAFTGAFQRRAGIFELAEGGALLLDEIGDMDIRLQAKLLQVLQDSEFRRLGGKETIRADVRVFAATHRNLEGAILDGEFRADLYYRLNVVSLMLPPLRERKEDLQGLAECLISRHFGSADLARNLLTSSLRAEMTAYDWPGNIRELENVVRKLIVLGDPEIIATDLRQRARLRAAAPFAPEAAASQLTAPTGDGDPGSALQRLAQEKQDAEREAILAALNTTRWSRKQAAVLLQVDYKALLYKMKKLGIDG